MAKILQLLLNVVETVFAYPLYRKNALYGSTEGVVFQVAKDLFHKAKEVKYARAMRHDDA